jgi:NAD(P)H-hydrate repair Nnr-like enzyme with NAD(P)H-hydrate epimerase domain
MLPVLTPSQMAAVDAAAPEPIDELIDRAGRAVARVALDMLGGSYGRVVVVIAGKGNNGADGRVAAAVLRRRGVQVKIFDAAALPATLPSACLVIDAAYGTGFRGEWLAPDVGTTPVLAVDVPSGVDALTGVASGHVLRADCTVTFQAMKTGLLFGDGALLSWPGGLDVPPMPTSGAALFV